jgi:hypothetical protein
LALWSYDNDSKNVKPLVALAHMAVQCSLYLHQQLDNFQVDVTAMPAVASASLTLNSSSKASFYRKNGGGTSFESFRAKEYL